MTRIITFHPSDFATGNDWIYFLQQAGIEKPAHTVDFVIFHVEDDSIFITATD